MKRDLSLPVKSPPQLVRRLRSLMKGTLVSYKNITHTLDLLPKIAVFQQLLKCIGLTGNNCGVLSVVSIRLFVGVQPADGVEGRGNTGVVFAVLVKSE